MRLMIVGLVALALALAACDGGEDAAVGVADVERYCELTEMLDEAGEEQIEVDFEAATPDPETVRAEFSDFLDQNSEDIDELERVAPPEIADEVTTLTETIRQVAETGDLSAFEESTEADERIQEFERQACGTTS